MKKIKLLSFLLLFSVSVFAQLSKDREFVDVPYSVSIETIEFTVLDINFDNNLVAFKHVFKLLTQYDEMGKVYQKPCDCNYTGMQDNPTAGVVLGVYDLSKQEYLKTFTIYNSTFKNTECFDFETSSTNLDLAKQYFKKHNLDITKKPESQNFSDEIIKIDGITFSYTNERTMNDDMSDMNTVSRFFATQKHKELIYIVNQEDLYYMASGGTTSYLSAFKQNDKVVFLSIFEHISAMAGSPNTETYQFSPVFEISKLKKMLH